MDDEGILEEYEIKGGAKINYIIMIAWRLLKIKDQKMEQKH